MSWDKGWVRRSFDRAATHYDRWAELQRQIGERLLAALPERPPAGWLVDVGSGTGECAQVLARRYHRPVVVLDIAFGMLKEAQRKLQRKAYFMVGDAEALPLADSCAGLVVTNLALQWCLKPHQALAEISRVLLPSGMLLFSSLTTGTLEELRLAWGQVDSYSHVNRFVTSQDLNHALARAGFSRWHLTQEKIVRRYSSVLSLLKEIKEIGARNVTLGRPRHLLGKKTLTKLIAAYGGGEIEASFFPVYGWAVR